MTRACLHVGFLLERRAAGLNEAERLVIERHLSSCASCREQSAVLSGLRALSDRASERPSLPRERLIASAMQRAELGEQPLPVEEKRRKRVVQVVVALALAAGLALFVAVRHAQRPTLAVATSAELTRSQLVAGVVTAHEHQLVLGEAIPEDTPLVIEQASDLALNHAHVRTSEATQGQWHQREVTFSLERGALDVSVDPAPKRPFSVRTSRFAVEVLGTEFHVSTSDVRVSRGLVRVVSPSGAELARVAAGQSWELSGAVSASASAALPASASAPAEALLPPSVEQRLVLARHALASRDLASAKRELGRALAEHPSLAEEGEARMLLGDWARLSGDPARAAREYLAAFERSRGQQRAETALFSAARAEASAGHAARSRELFRQYLTQYPSGQFRHEASARVASPVRSEQE